VQKAVTLFFDIDRSSFSAYPRARSKYVSNFLNFFSKVKIDLLILTDLNEKNFIESQLESYKEEHQFLSKVTFQTLDYSFLPLYKDLTRIEKVLQSPEMFFYSMRDKISGNPNLNNFLKLGNLIRTLFAHKGNNIFEKFSLDKNPSNNIENKFLKLK
jgi:hypothetical protein